MEHWEDRAIKAEKKLAALKKPVPVEPECVKYLSQYEQADEDGVIVKVSRQAIHETLSHIDSLVSALQRAQDKADAEFGARTRLQSRINELEEEKADWSNGEESQRERAEKAESLNRRMVELLKEPSAYMVHFTTKLGGATVADRITVWRKESAKEHVREELITKIEPLYEVSEQLLKEVGE